MTAHDSTSDVPASRNASSIAELSLGEQSSLFSVPANGTVELRGLRIIDVTLPSAPFPLPASGFLALSAFRLGAGARLRLVDSFLTVPSCALLSLHQTYACGVSPSPNVTVTPSSLVVHRLTTPSLDATNVTVQCSGAAAPYPCLAESFPGQVPLLSYMQRASQTISVAARTYGGTPPPVYGFLTRDMALVDPAAARYDTGGGAATCGNGSSGSNGTAAGDAPQQLLGDPDTVGPQRAPEASSACAAIAWGNRLVLAGDGTAQQRTVLDLAHSTSMLYLQIPDGKVEFRNLTLRNPPPGPPGYLPYTLLRLPIWTAAFKRKILGSDIDRLLTVTDCTVELPPEEVAMLMADAGLAAAALPPSLSGLLCAAGSDLLYNTRRYNTSRFTDVEVYLSSFIGLGTRSVYTRVQLRAVWPLQRPFLAPVSGGDGTGDTQQPQQPQPQPHALGMLATYPSYPSVCAAGAPGQPSPASLDRAPVASLALLRPWRLTTQDTDPTRGVDQRTGIVMLCDALLLSSDDPFFAPSYGQVQSDVTMPSLVLGEPLSLRLLHASDVSSAVTIAQPRAALTLRWLVLVGLPAARGFTQLPLGPRRRGQASPPPPASPKQVAAPSPPSLTLGGGGTALDDSGHSVSGRRLRQLQHGSGSRPAHLWSYNRLGSGDGALGRRGIGSSPHRRLQQEEQQQQAGSSSATQGLAPALANFTSCLWTFEFDRSPEALAADLAGGAGGRPAGLPRLQLDGVVLVVPQAELQLLGRVWAASADLLSGRLAFSADTDPGLAAALRAMLEGSALLEPQPGPTGSSTQDRVYLHSDGMLEFEEVAWCGWNGYNVTLITEGDADLGNAVTVLRIDNAPYVAITTAVVSPALTLPVVEFTASPSAAAPGPQGDMTSAPGGAVAVVPSAAPPPGASADQQPQQQQQQPQQQQRLPAGHSPAPRPAPDTQQPGQQGSGSTGGSSAAEAPEALGGAEPIQQPQGSNSEGSSGGSSGAVLPSQSAVAGGSKSEAGTVVAIVVSCVGAATVTGGLLLLYVGYRSRHARRYHGASAAGKAVADRLSSAADSDLLRTSTVSGSGVTEPRRDSGAASRGDSRRGGKSRLALGSSALSASQEVTAETSSYALGSSGCSGPTGSNATSSAAGGAADGTTASGRLGTINRAMVGMLLAVEEGRRRVAHLGPDVGPVGGAAPSADAAARPGAAVAEVAAGAAQLAGGNFPIAASVADPSSVHDANVPLLRLPTSTTAACGPVSAGAAGLAVVPLESSPLQSGAIGCGGHGDGTAAATQLQPQPPSPHTSLPLTITGELGRGAQGVVYRGVWRGLDVAVKSVLFHLEPGPGGAARDVPVQRAVQEAAIAVSMAHPNIVATYTYQLQPLQAQAPNAHSEQWVRTGNDSYLGTTVDCTGSGSGSSATPGHAAEAEVWKLTLIQELCDANSLRHCLQSGLLLLGRQAGAGAGVGTGSDAGQSTALQPPPARTMLLLACDIARGLAHLHERGVVHADLSSNNVLLQSTAGRPPRMSAPGATGGGPPAPNSSAVDTGLCVVAKLCDFGLSGRLDVEADATHLSGPARRSSAYSAPELVAHGRSGPAGDVYAFAVVLWELALGLPLPVALVRPESAGLRAWQSEQARLLPLGDDDLNASGTGGQASDVALASLALPPGLLWWPPGTPAGLVSLVAECLRPEPRSRPPAAAVLQRLQARLLSPQGVGEERQGSRHWKGILGIMTALLGFE